MNAKQLFVENKLLFVVFAVVFCVATTLAWLPIEKIITGFMPDDSFYYFQIGRNIAGGFGSTFDGVHLTNGYHPFWMGIVVAVFYFFGNYSVLPIHILLTISVVLFMLSSFVVNKILAMILGNQRKKLVTFLTIMFVANPWNITFALNGLETSLAILLFTVYVYFVLKLINKSFLWQNYLFLGILGGLLTLGRTDHIFFAVFLGLFILLRNSKTSIKEFLLIGVGGALVVTPWLIFNYMYFGAILPDSGLARALAIKQLFFYKTRPIWQVVVYTFYNFFMTWYKIIVVSGILPFILFAVYKVVKNFKQSLAWFKLMVSDKNILTILSFLMAFVSFTILQGGIRWVRSEWYFFSFLILIIILFAQVVLKFAIIEKSLEKYSATAIVLLICTFVYYGSYLFIRMPSQLDLYDSAKWISKNLPLDAKVASFNSGIIGYFSDRFVMNSDGLANNSALIAKQKKQLWQLFEENKINYIVDYEIALTYRHNLSLGIVNPLSRLYVIKTISSGKELYGNSKISVYQLK